jgi:mannosylfructose-phosphate synthase
MTTNKDSLNIINRTSWTQGGWVLIGVAFATLIRLPIQPIIHNASPFLLYFPVVVFVAVIFGPKFGLLATIGSVLPADYFWMAPERAFAIDLGGLCQILGFSFAGCSVAWLSATVRKRKQLEELLRATLASVGDAIVTTDCGGRIVYLNVMAQMLTELHGEESTGYMIGSALDLVADDGQHSLAGTFQVAVKEDDVENLPKRVILISKTGRRHRVEQKVSRVLDPTGRKLGMVLLFHRSELDTDLEPMPIVRTTKDFLNLKSKLPRIAMVSTHGYVAAHPPLGASDTGGQVVYVLELSKKVAQLGYEVDIWTRQFEDQSEIEHVSEQVRIIRAPCGGRNFIPKERLHDALPQWNENALQFIKEHRLDYEFINSHYWDGGMAAQHLSRVLDVPHIHTPHSLGIWKKRQTEVACPEDAAKIEEQNNFVQRIYHEQALYASADIVVATSSQQLEILLRDYKVPAEKCRMIPPGYDDTRFFPVSESSRRAIRNRLGFNTPVVQAIGRLADNKGYELLIKAFHVVAQRMPDTVLQLAVGGKNLIPQEVEMLVRLKALVSELHLAGKVQFKGFIPDDQLPDYYRAADVFVLSSRYEPFGMTAVEAMACGTPTVLTVHGGLYHVVDFGQHGLYADPFDPEDLGMMIFKVLKYPRLRSRLSRLGAQQARSMFTWTGIAQQFIELVECKSAKNTTLGDIQSHQSEG